MPVRNEAEHIEQTLEALRLQTDAGGQPLDDKLYEVLVLVNNCTDDSYRIIKNYQGRHPEFNLHAETVSLPYSLAHIGPVRRLLMDEASRRLLLAGNREGIIASTDGDTLVDSQWIYYLLDEIGRGNDAVGGRILTLNQSGSARRHHLRDVTYRCLLAQAEALIDPQPHDPQPQHFQFFGANMAVTCAAYRKAGGIPLLQSLEDVAFYRILAQHDALIRKSSKARVYTSDRIDGRVNVGFSEQLRRWAQEHEDNKPQQVIPVSHFLHLFRLRRRTRLQWQQYITYKTTNCGELEAIAAQLHVDAGWMLEQLTASAYFGKLWDMLDKAANKVLRPRPQPVQQAIEQLRTFIKSPHTTVFQIDPAGTGLPADDAGVEFRQAV